MSHTELSRLVLTAGIGEIANALKLKTLVESNGEWNVEICDVFSWLGKAYEPLAQLNYKLAESGESMIEGVAWAEPLASEISGDYKAVLLLSWSWSLAALVATNLHKRFPLIAKLYVHQDNEIVFPKLYEQCDLLITESLLASKRAIHYGIPAWKIVYLPHHAPHAIHSNDRSFIEKRAAECHKNCGSNTVILGVCSRLEYGKNVEYALECARRLHLEGHDILLYLKGDVDEATAHVEYRDFILEKLKQLEDESWLLWDKAPTPFSEIFTLYSGFDICLHLSGAEAGSNTIVEFLSLGKPTLILDTTTNPSLFKGAAMFVAVEGPLRLGPMPFYNPDLDDLTNKLRTLVTEKEERKKWAQWAYDIAKKRFNPQITTARFPLMIQAAEAYRNGEKWPQSTLLEWYEEDLRAYDY